MYYTEVTKESFRPAPRRLTLKEFKAIIKEYKKRGGSLESQKEAYKLVVTKKRQFLQQGVVRKCPGCGASLSVNTKGVCEYCGTTYNMEDYNYILTSITNTN